MRTRWMLFVVIGVAALGSTPVFAQGKDSGAELLLKQQAEEQAQEAARKSELADAIVNARQTAANRDFGARLRESLKQSLLSLSVERLEAFQSAGGLGDIAAAVQDGSVTNALGDSAKDLAFTPVPPCRVVDTRSAVAGILVAGSTRSFKVRDVAGFVAQGGVATDCGIPLTATAVEMNFVAVSAVGPGDLRAYAFGGTQPPSSVINYSNVPGAPFLNIANGIAQPVCDPTGPTPCTSDVSVLTEAANTHLIIDVVGFFNKVNKAQVKSFVVTSRSGSTTAIPASPGCANYTGGSVAVNAPVAGTVLVRANVILNIAHTAGTQDYQAILLATANNDCVNPGFGYSSWGLISEAEPTGTYFPTLTTFRTFNVAAGVTTFFLNGQKQSGAGVHNFWFSGMEATFIPD